MTNLKEVYTQIYDKWLTDLTFRTQFKENPRQALNMLNLGLNPDDMQTLQTMLRPDKSENEELNKRISK